MMPPLPRADIAPRAACERRITATTSTSSMACSCSTSLSPNRFFSPKPALLTSRSTGRSSDGDPLLDDGQLLAVDEVGRQHLGAHAVRRLEIPGDRLEAGGVAGHQDEVVAPGRELAGELQADAGRGAGHEGGRHASIEPGACGNSHARVRHDGRR